jgi:microsomal dipeptidase-like Zn-dependent dipeptidase
MLPKLFEELRSRGYSEDDIAKIAGGNFLRVLDEVASL